MDRSRRLGLRYGLLIGGIMLVASYVLSLWLLNPHRELTVKGEELAMANAAGYLVRHLDADGKFAYLIHLDGSPSIGQYNIVRHAGALYALAMYHDVKPDPKIRDAIVRGAQFLMRRHVQSVPKQPAMRAVYSFPGEEISGTNALVKLGGCGLGLLVLAKAHELDPATAPIEVLRELGNFILFMQEPNGRFHSTYDADHGFGPFESLFYPGEAILGLASMHRVDPDPRWLEAALKGVLYLESSREKLPVSRLPSDHWQMIATTALLVQGNSASSSLVYRQQFEKHLRVLGKKMMDEQQRMSWLPGYEGAFDLDGSVSSAATRLEGLVALETLLPPGDTFRERVDRSIRKGLTFLLRAQVQEGKAKGGFTDAVCWNVLFRRQAANEVRIDYVEHALCALVGYYKIEQPPY